MGEALAVKGKRTGIVQDLTKILLDIQSVFVLCVLLGLTRTNQLYKLKSLSSFPPMTVFTVLLFVIALGSVDAVWLAYRMECILRYASRRNHLARRISDTRNKKIICYLALIVIMF